MQKFKLGDTIKVLSGKDRGKTGQLLKVRGERALVKGINMQTKHVKGQGDKKGQIIKKEGTVHISNIMLICPHTNKSTRVGIKVLDNGKRVRFSKKAKKEIADSFVKSEKKMKRKK